MSSPAAEPQGAERSPLLSEFLLREKVWLDAILASEFFPAQYKS